MTPDEQRIAIGAACGLTRESLGPDWDKLPDYPNDLNAMHEAEKTLSENERCKYADHLLGNGAGEDGLDLFDAVHRTAAQRAEAFLRMKGLWREQPQAVPQPPNSPPSGTRATGGVRIIRELDL